MKFSKPTLSEVFVCAAIVLALAFLLRPIHHDRSLYLLIDQQVAVAQSKLPIKVPQAYPFRERIGEKEFAGMAYLQPEAVLVLIVEEPERSGWLFGSIMKGSCYKLFGDGAVAGMFSKVRTVCEGKAASP